MDAASSCLTGVATKVRIVSNNVGCSPCPAPDEEVEQHLSITADGRVFFSAYAYGDGNKHRKSRTRNFMIDPGKASFIVKSISEYFSAGFTEEFVTDVGDWEITITNNETATYRYRGSLGSRCSKERNRYSKMIRCDLDMPDLLVFDGCADSDRIEKVSIDYHRVTRIKPGMVQEGASWDYVTWDYSEHLTIDRATETLEHIQNIGTGCQVSRKYRVEDGIASLLDDLDAGAFFTNTKGNPPDVVRNPLETKEYTITIDYLYGEQRLLTGSFDKNGLPEDFAGFAENLFGFMRFYGMGEILDPSVHGKVLRKQSDYIFCNVQFDEYGKTYCYLTDDDTLEAGDRIVVPTGENNHETFATIESIEYHPADEAPFPIGRIKRIIRKVNDSDETGEADDDAQ